MSSVDAEISASLIRKVIDKSSGEPGWVSLPPSTRAWLGGLSEQLPTTFTIHRDGPACELARKFGAAGFAFENHIVIDAALPEQSEAVLRHELVHLAQFGLADRGIEASKTDDLEAEAHELASLQLARPARFAANSSKAHMLFWFLLLGAAGVGVAASTTPANAPEANSATLPPKSEWQIFGDTLSFIVVPGGAMALGSRFGLGFLGSTSLAGAATGVSLRASSDVGQGRLSPPLMYVTDALTGAVIGWVVPGGIRFIGRQGTVAFDKLATWGLKRSDIKIAHVLHDAAMQQPLNAAAAHTILGRQGLIGGVSRWWLDRRQVIILYRGQTHATNEILAPFARPPSNVAASEALTARLQSLGMNRQYIANQTASFHDVPFRAGDKISKGVMVPDDLIGVAPGAVGIPSSRLPGIARGFGDDGVIYVIRLPKDVPLRAQGWQSLGLEQEHIILNSIPRGSVVGVMPARSIKPVWVDQAGRLAARPPVQ